MSEREQLDQMMGPASELSCGDMTCWRSPSNGSHPLVGPSWLAPKLNGDKVDMKRGHFSTLVNRVVVDYLTHIIHDTF